MPGPFYGNSPEDGFQELKDKWAQKGHFGAQSECLAQNLATAIEATRRAVPRREGNFSLERTANQAINEAQRERIWERSVFVRWNGGDVAPVKNCWDRVIAFQTPLFAKQKKSGWGYVDLLGFIGNGTPSVIELKKDPRTRESGGVDNTESPLRIVLEAAAYAVALRVNWTNFRPEYIDRLRQLDVSDTVISGVPQTLNEVRLVGAAPASYWLDWLPITKKGTTIPKDTWKSFKELLDALDKEGLPTSFVSLSGDSDLPELLAAQPLTEFPLLS
jgi:hypothetical protein